MQIDHSQIARLLSKMLCHSDNPLNAGNLSIGKFFAAALLGKLPSDPGNRKAHLGPVNLAVMVKIQEFW